MHAARSWPRPAWRPARQPAAMRQEQPGNPSDAHTGREHPSAHSASAASTAYRLAPHPYWPILAMRCPKPHIIFLALAHDINTSVTNARPHRHFPAAEQASRPARASSPRRRAICQAASRVLAAHLRLAPAQRSATARNCSARRHVTEAGPESATSRCLSGTGLRAPDGPRIEVPRRRVTMARRRRPSPGEYGDDSTTGLGRTPISRPAFQQPAYQLRPRHSIASTTSRLFLMHG